MDHDTNPTPEPVRLATVTPLADRANPLPVTGRATYTVPEVAKLLGISRPTVYAQLAAGQIPARRIGRRWIIARHRFNVWLNQTPADELLPTGTEAGR